MPPFPYEIILGTKIVRAKRVFAHHAHEAAFKPIFHKKMGSVYDGVNQKKLPLQKFEFCCPFFAWTIKTIL